MKRFTLFFTVLVLCCVAPITPASAQDSQAKLTDYVVGVTPTYQIVGSCPADWPVWNKISGTATTLIGLFQNASGTNLSDTNSMSLALLATEANVVCVYPKLDNNSFIYIAFEQQLSLLEGSTLEKATPIYINGRQDGYVIVPNLPTSIVLSVLYPDNASRLVFITQIEAAPGTWDKQSALLSQLAVSLRIKGEDIDRMAPANLAISSINATPTTNPIGSVVPTPTPNQ